ncbi:MAG TPA: hypothetical protein VLI90_12925 [Tepidisphaeraceae bacterium]|nr:hypothetical protein [Tepidisphaeraceae bacterium]
MAPVAQPALAARISEPQPIPIWASVLVILLCLGGGGWIMHWYVTSDPLSHETKLLDPGVIPAAPTRTPPSARGNNMAAAQAAPAVRKQDDTSWWVHAPEAAMLIDTKAKPPTIKVINYTNYEFVPQEDRTRIISARRIARDDAVAKSLDLTPDQVTKMRGLTAQIGMVTDPADLENLKNLWTAYDAASNKPAAETALVQALTATARKSIDKTKQAAAERSAKIKAVLTDEQWKKFDAMGR